MIKNYAVGFKNRWAEMSMTHVGLGSNFWHPYDIRYLVTGRA